MWTRVAVVSLCGSSDNLQEEEEDLDDVDVDGERSEHVLLWADGVLPVPDEQLCVISQEQGEGDGSQSCIKHVKPQHIFEGQDNGCNDASHKHYDPKDAEEALALGEVDLCLEAEDGNSDADDGRDPQRQKHCFCVIVTGYGPGHVGQSQSKDEQQNDVPWKLPPGALTANQHEVGDDINSI